VESATRRRRKQSSADVVKSPGSAETACVWEGAKSLAGKPVDRAARPRSNSRSLCAMPDLHPTTNSVPRRRDLTLPAGFIEPCLPMLAPRAPSGPLWLHEIKHDGLRIIARSDGGRVRLYGRTRNDVTKRFPLIVAAMARLPACTIDGEAVVCDGSGIASFDLLCRGDWDDRAFLYAFDLIELDHDDRRRDPLAWRKLDLGRLLANSAPGLVYNEWIDGSESDGATVFDRACRLDLQGIVSKRKDSRYLSGRSPYWLKMKNPKAARGRETVGSAVQGAQAIVERGR
jgi:bifunctional non-homologous end joining protein LigD